MSDRLAVMARGKVEQSAAAARVPAPQSAFVADFLGVWNLMRLGRRRSARRRRRSRADRDAGRDQPGRRRPRLTIRPERVRIEPPSTQGENRVPATIERFVYLGSTTQVFVALPGGDRVQALVANSATSRSTTSGAVTAHLPADALRVLADDEAVTA